MVVLIAILMVELTVKDGWSVLLSRHVDFCALGVGVHDDLIGPFFLLYIDVCLDCDGVDNFEVIRMSHA